jgi:hypothetical protein
MPWLASGYGRPSVVLRRRSARQDGGRGRGSLAARIYSQHARTHQDVGRQVLRGPIEEWKALVPLPKTQVVHLCQPADVLATLCE